MTQATAATCTVFKNQRGNSVSVSMKSKCSTVQGAGQKMDWKLRTCSSVLKAVISTQ